MSTIDEIAAGDARACAAPGGPAAPWCASRGVVATGKKASWQELVISDGSGA